MCRELSEHGHKNRATQQKLYRPCLDNSIARNRGQVCSGYGESIRSHSSECSIHTTPNGCPSAQIIPIDRALC